MWLETLMDFSIVSTFTAYDLFSDSFLIKAEIKDVC